MRWWGWLLLWLAPGTLLTLCWVLFVEYRLWRARRGRS
jgi:hypothetical protein